MKNLLIISLFSIGLFGGYANAETSSTKGYGCTTVHLSCGVSGKVCGENTLELIKNALAADEMHCPE